jgi:LysM repeat protein
MAVGLGLGAIPVPKSDRMPVRPPSTVSHDSVHVAHVVCRGETVEDIARRYRVGADAIRVWNGIEGSNLRAGQRLVLWTPASTPVDDSQILDEELPPPEPAPPAAPPAAPDPLPEIVHVVERGETLSGIAERYQTSVSSLRTLNGIEGSRILVGQKIRLRSTPPATHLVETGDALSEIANAYGLSTRELKALNALSSDRIYPGQMLRLSNADPPRLDTYEVRQDDTLSEIARLHQMSVLELREANGLEGNVVHPGQKLHVRPILRGAPPPAGEKRPPTIDWGALAVEVPKVRLREAENGPYYGKMPRASFQKDQRYVEDRTSGASRQAFTQARTLFDLFAKKVDALPPISQKLEGWHIVLDPGHGGIDPGSITKVLDGRGNPVYVVEDEYVYDIVLRMYVLLRLNGAEVTLTLLSPNHLVRRSDPATRTFVHERNEVYNSPSLNPPNGQGQWPKGGQNGLSARVRVATEALRESRSRHTLFLSIHADNSPDRDAVPVVLYYASSKRVDDASRRFAQALVPSLGAGSEARGRNLAVLRRNAADASVLVEIRNVAHSDHAWALRFEELRQRDAEKIVRGILEFASH